MSSLLPSAEVLVEVFRFLKRVEISQIELVNSWFHALVEEHLSEYPYIRIYSIFIDLWLGGPNLQSVIGCKVVFIDTKFVRHVFNTNRVSTNELSLSESMRFFKVAYLRAESTTIRLWGNTSIPQLDSPFMTNDIRIEELFISIKHIWTCNGLSVNIKNDGDDDYWPTSQSIACLNECAYGVRVFTCSLEKMPQAFPLTQIYSNLLNLKGPIEQYAIKAIYSWLTNKKIPSKFDDRNYLAFNDVDGTQETANYINELLTIIESKFEQQFNVQYLIWMIPNVAEDSDFWQLLPPSFIRHNKEGTVVFKYTQDKMTVKIWRYMKCNEHRMFDRSISLKI